MPTSYHCSLPFCDTHAETSVSSVTYTHTHCNKNDEETAVSKPVVPKETKNIVSDDGKHYICQKFTNGHFVGMRRIIPSVKFVKFYGEKDGNPCCTEVFFKDGTSERAVLSENDTFNLEQSISICITKKILSMLCGVSGSSVYNKLIKYCMDVVYSEVEELKKKKAKEKEEAEREKRFIEKKARKAAKRAESERKKAEEEREKEINMQVEINLRIIDELMKKYGFANEQSTPEATV